METKTGNSYYHEITTQPSNIPAKTVKAVIQVLVLQAKTSFPWLNTLHSSLVEQFGFKPQQKKGSEGRKKSSEEAGEKRRVPARMGKQIPNN